jgi:hypothetical protein
LLFYKTYANIYSVPTLIQIMTNPGNQLPTHQSPEHLNPDQLFDAMAALPSTMHEKLQGNVFIMRADVQFPLDSGKASVPEGIFQTPIALVKAGDEVFSVVNVMHKTELDHSIERTILTRLSPNGDRAEFVGILGEKPLAVGREYQRDMHLGDMTSRRHFLISKTHGESITIGDTQSSNGTEVIIGRQTMPDNHPLHDHRIWGMESAKVKEIVTNSEEDRMQRVGKPATDKVVVVLDDAEPSERAADKLVVTLDREADDSSTDSEAYVFDMSKLFAPVEAPQGSGDKVKFHRGAVTPESQQDAADWLDSTRLDPSIKELVWGFDGIDAKGPKDTMVDVLRTNPALRRQLGSMLYGKMTSPFMREQLAGTDIVSNKIKNPPLPGYPKHMTSRQYAVLLAMSMLDGTFKKELAMTRKGNIYGPITDPDGDGQHRYAAEKLLTARPDTKSK